jgi:putative PIN family toxin of toxin-antitoxin system
LVRAVLDPNVIIAATLSRHGSPALILRGWLHGEFEAIVSPLLLAELQRALSYPKLRQCITAGEAEDLLDLLATSATVSHDPEERPPVRSSDPGDDYLISLAAFHSAALVSGDRHLLDLGETMPVFSPADFLELLRTDPGRHQQAP